MMSTTPCTPAATTEATPRRRASDRLPPAPPRAWVYGEAPPTGTGRVLLLTWQGTEILGKWRSDEYQAWAALPERDSAREAALLHAKSAP